MEFDPYLYVAFALGVVAGHFVHPHPRWVPRATIATVVVLVGLLGASLDTAPLLSLALAVPYALLFAFAILLATAIIYRLLNPRPAPPTSPPPEARTGARPTVSLVLITALFVGLGIGRVVSFPALATIPWVLYVLLALVGFDITLRLSALRGVWVPITAAVVGALAAAAIFTGVGRLPIGVSLATALGFGFYSLTGPLVVARAGAFLGLVAFLTNFLREDLTMILSPYLGRRLGGVGLTALGGATSMDTTLYFVTRYGDPEAGSLALANGLVLTIAASLLVPAVLALPV